MYDYIVIGAGSAGSVVAARLSEDPATSVLVLEGGPPDDLPEIAMPAATPALWSGPLTWDNATVPQRHAARRVIPWPSGRTLGGSSSINGMIYIRGNPLDYDNWRDAYGCTGWGHADLLPYFLRAEDQQRGGSAWHGTGGPLRVEDQRYEHPLSRAWLEAAITWGLPGNEDFNGDRSAHGRYPRAGVRGRRQEGDAISSTSLDIALAVIAAAAAVVAVWRSVLAGRQAREAKKSRELSAVISLFNAHESEDALRIRRLIRNGTLADRLDDPDIRFQLRHYIHQLNFIATLRSRQLLGDELVKGLFYEAARSCWEQCARSFVHEIRTTQNPDFAQELQNWVGAPDP